MRILILVLILFDSICFAQTNKALSELINAEKSFAALSETKSTKAAFMENLSPNAILFRRGIVNGITFWQNALEGNDKLTWEPQYADISIGEDFGYTTGPFQQFQNRTDAQPAGGGHYLSIWQKENGVWKVLFDGGIGHPPVDLTNWETKSGIVTTKGTERPDQIKEHLTRLESNFQADFKQKGPSAFTSYVSSEVRMYRPMKPPYRKQNLQELLSETDKKFTYENPVDLKVAPSGDMAFNYGNVSIEITRDGNTRQLKGNYLRIWKKEKGQDWKIVVDLISL